MAPEKKVILPERAEEIIIELRKILSETKETTEAISKIITYAEANDLRYIGLDFHRTGSVTFKITSKDFRKRTIKITSKFNN